MKVRRCCKQLRRVWSVPVEEDVMSDQLEIAGTPGELYERHLVPAIFSRWAPEVVEAAGVQPGQRVLDVACGTGAVTRCLAGRVGRTGRVVGLDFNAGMLAAA